MEAKEQNEIGLENEKYNKITTYLTFCFRGHSFMEIDDPSNIPDIKQLSKEEGMFLVLSGPYLCHRIKWAISLS